MPLESNRTSSPKHTQPARTISNFWMKFQTLGLANSKITELDVRDKHLPGNSALRDRSGYDAIL